MLMRSLVASSLALVLSLSLLTGCAGESTTVQPQESSQSSAAGEFYRFVDSLGNDVVFKEAPKRVVALFGSYAETWTLAGGELIGVTDDVVSERGMTLPEGTQVVGSLIEPSLEEVLGLEPDFVLLTADLEGQVKLDSLLTQAGIPHAYFKVELFQDYLSMLKICTDITGRADLYEQNGLAVQRQIEEILQKIQVPEQKPTALLIRAMSTKAKARADDSMVCQMLEELGVENIAARYPSLLEELSMETIIEEDPDYIFVTTMGNSQKAIDALAAGIQSNPAWAGLSAVKEDRYVILPKDLFHYKPNARWAESYAHLAKILYPSLF